MSEGHEIMDDIITYKDVTAILDCTHIRYFSDDVLLGMFLVQTEDWENEAKETIEYFTCNPSKKYVKKQRAKMNNGLRYKIMRRDGFQCQMCGASGQNARLEVDHIWPVSKAGTSGEDNLQTLCKKCNIGKGSSTSL